LAVLFPLLGAAFNGVLAARGSRAKGLVSVVGVGTLAAAFAVASLLALLALVTLALKSFIEWRLRDEIEHQHLGQ